MCEREGETVCVCMHIQSSIITSELMACEGERVCVCEREMKRERESVCVCVRERERECVYVSMNGTGTIPSCISTCIPPLSVYTFMDYNH